MTIRVTISNDELWDDLRNADKILEVVDGGGAKHIVPPGRNVTVHVWHGTQITITEADLKGATGERRGGPDGYGALPPR